MKKKPFTITKLEEGTPKSIDGNFDIAFKNKIESINYTSYSTGTSVQAIKSFQEMEHGQYEYTAANTAVMTLNISFIQTYREIFSIQVTPLGNRLEAWVGNYTGSSMQVMAFVSAVGATADKFFYTVIGSLE